MPPKEPDPDALKTLDNLLQTTSTLVSQLGSALVEIADQTNDRTQPASAPSKAVAASPDFDPLALARDASSLIRAHATKVSLLIINSPFSPTAVTSVIRDMISPNGAIPGLASAVQACDGARYTEAFRKELAWHTRRVFQEVGVLLAKVPKDGKSLKAENEGFGGAGKGSVASTGVLWAACDELTKLVQGGVAGLFVAKVEQWKETLKDLMEEMKEWSEEEPEDDDEEDDDADGAGGLASEMGSTHIDAQAMIDDMMSAQRPIPRDDPQNIRPRLDTSIKRLRLVILLYQAIHKRRIKALPLIPIAGTADREETARLNTVPSRLDEVSKVMQTLPDRFNDLQFAFYEQNSSEIDKLMDQCFLDAFAVSELLRDSWDGKQDAFSEWAGKFQMEIRKA